MPDGWTGVRGAGRVVLPAALACGLLLAACARQSAPPGGPPDARPPVVIRTTPDPLAEVPDFTGPVRFEFDERISEQGGAGPLDEAVTVSPRTGEVRVGHGRRSLSVEVGGGFLPGIVYRVTLLPVVRDMFGNVLQDPFELVFSTGGEPDETAVAGEVWDRVTGRGVGGYSLNAVSEDSLVYLASSSEGGIYAFRYLPSGSYDVTAFDDQDRDGEPGPSETRGSFALDVAPGDTLFVDVPVVAPDTTAAVLLGAEVMDSITLALRFDDYVDPGSALDDLSVSVVGESGESPAVRRLFHAAEWIQHVESVTDSLARVDSIARAEAPPPEVVTPGAGDTLAGVDTLAGADSLPAIDPLPVADTLARSDSLQAADSLALPGADPRVPGANRRRGPAPLPGGGIQGLDQALTRGRVLPGRRIVIVLEEPLDPGDAYTVSVDGVVNLEGREGGGGEVPAEWLDGAGAVADPPGGAR
ncbi:MAG: Ig-like domain-containing protein [Gemmatimonadota bacterium]